MQTLDELIRLFGNDAITLRKGALDWYANFTSANTGWTSRSVSGDSPEQALKALLIVRQEKR